jgi:cobalt/nickel transport system permease protein
MKQANSFFFDIGTMETLASGDSFLHRLDPRAKLITTLAFIVAVVSFDRYALSGLVPFFIYPAVLIGASGLPAGYLASRVFLVAPFAILVGIFNPFFDREVLFRVGSLGVSGGWVSFLSILLRFFLTTLAALVLLASTGFNAVCDSLLKFGVPRPFVVQLLFFHRYAFVLTDEAGRMIRARSLRTFRAGAAGPGIFVPMVGHLLLRTWDRAERIYLAMCSRGFDGRLPLTRSMKIGMREIIFVSGWLLLFVWLRGAR